jgi:putative nucleotidyltransferase with HDIG domain
MSSAEQTSLRPAARNYITAVTTAGLCLVALGAGELLRAGLPDDFKWLAVLTLLSGFLPVKLPKVHANISVSETFVFCGTLLFGPSAGAVLVFLDVALIWAKLASKQVLWHRMIFSLGANPLSIWLAGVVLFWVAGTDPMSALAIQPPTLRLIAGLSCFALLYFLLNSWLVAIAISLEEGPGPFAIWSKHFSRLWMNYWAGASVAGLLVSISHSLSIVPLLLIAPLMLVLLVTYRWSTERVEKAEAHLSEMKRTFLQTIEALALAIDAKDQVTHGHIRRVQRFTMALADALGIRDEQQLDALRAAALLHDTGKLAVPEYILNKPGPLSASEFERMKLHATVGADILKSIEFPYPVEPIVRHHHENWNGTGYPAGLREQEIPLGARILSVVDCYDALTSDRPYRPRYSREHAEQVLRERRGVMYDPWVVDEFMKILDDLERPEFRDDSEPAPQTGANRVDVPDQLEFISATNAEDREFNELRRELPKAASVAEAADILFRHMRRVIPAATCTLFLPKPDSSEITPVACAGVGLSVFEGLRIQIGEKVSGWAFAHRQVVLNSNASLELGPVARTLSVPLRYALSVPILNGPGAPIGVIAFYGSEPFDNDHRRMLESAATLFVGALSQPVNELVTSGASAASSPASRIH